jgi:hypothetical protein
MGNESRDECSRSNEGEGADMSSPFHHLMPCSLFHTWQRNAVDVPINVPIFACYKKGIDHLKNSTYERYFVHRCNAT